MRQKNVVFTTDWGVPIRQFNQTKKKKKRLSDDICLIRISEGLGCRNPRARPEGSRTGRIPADSFVEGVFFWRELHQGKTPWVDQSCADCPGFPVLGAGHAPPPELHLGASGCAPGLAFAFMTLRANLGSAAPNFPTTRAKTGRTAHVFAAQGGTRRLQDCRGDMQRQWLRQ